MNLVGALGLHAPWLEIILRSAIVYVVILVGIRITGRQQLGQMTPFDLVLILLISNAVQNAMVGPDTTVLGGLVAAATLFALNSLTERVSDHIPGFRRAVEGDPILLVNDGAPVWDHVRSCRITEEMLLQSAREHGLSGLEDVHMAILEVDGTISIVPRDAKVMHSNRVVRHRHRVRVNRPGGA